MEPTQIGNEIACEVCQQMHRVGDAAWRDCQTKQFDDLVENPEKWIFNPTKDETKRVVQAHSAYMTEFVSQGVTSRNPDIQAIRLMMTREFKQDTQVGIRTMTKFWEDFNQDMPEAFKDKNFRHSLAFAWSDRKLVSILKTSNLPFVEWDQKELTCNLKLPDSLEAVAQSLRQFFSDSWQLYHFDTETLEGTTLAKYYLRRPKN